MIEIKHLEEIIQVVDKYNVSHFEFEHENSKVIIEKLGAGKETVDKVIKAPINLDEGIETCLKKALH